MQHQEDGDEVTVRPSVRLFAWGGIRKAWPLMKVPEFQEGLSASRLAGVTPTSQPESASGIRALRVGQQELDRNAHRVGACICSFFCPLSDSLLSDAGCNPPPSREDTADGQAMDSLGSRCKIVVVGDTQCGKTALLHVFAKDCYPETYVPTVFENYTASFEIDKHRIELNMWDTSGSSYYDNVRPLAYPDSDAVLICFDISRPETLDSVIKKWQGETQEFCPNAKVVLVGCKLDMRTDVNTLRELSKQRLIPVTHEQGSTIARQMGAVAYVECTSKVSENSVRDVFHITTLASVRRPHKPQLKRSSSRRGLKRVSQLPLPPLPGRTEQMDQAPVMRKDRAKSCVLM